MDPGVMEQEDLSEPVGLNKEDNTRLEGRERMARYNGLIAVGSPRARAEHAQSVQGIGPPKKKKKK